METVSVNNLTLCHKNTDGYVRSTMPDVCKSPSEPVPYTNTAFARTLANGTVRTFSNGGAMCGVLGSEFATSVGDEPGVGGGVISGVNMREATFISFSPNVFMEGRAVTRLTEKMLLNHANTVSVGGYFTDRLKGTALLDEICNAACDCKAAGTARQSCVDLRLRADHAATNTKGNGVFPEARYKMDEAGDWQLDTDSLGMPKTGGPYPHPDVTAMSGGNVSAIVEVKFLNNGDRYRLNQEATYNEIGASQNPPVRVQTVYFPKDCTCDDEPKKQPVPALAPQKQEQDNSFLAQARNFAQAHPGVVVGGVVVLGVGAAILTGGLAAGPALGLAAAAL